MAYKAALDELSKSMAFEFGQHNIRVNSVTLGCVWTNAFKRVMEISIGNSSPGFVAEAIKANSSIGGDPLVPMDGITESYPILSIYLIYLSYLWICSRCGQHGTLYFVRYVQQNEWWKYDFGCRLECCCLCLNYFVLPYNRSLDLNA